MTKIILAHELLEQGISKTRIAARLQVSRRTVIRWAQAIEQYGSLETYLEYYQQAKRGARRKRKSDAILKRRIWKLREQYHQCCGQKIRYFLQKEYQMDVSVTTIYKILSEKYQLRSRWQKNHERGSVLAAQAARQVVQMDTVVFGDVLPSRPSIFSPGRALCCCGLLWKLPMGKPFYASVCLNALRVMSRPFRQMAAVSSKVCFLRMCFCIVSGIA